MSPLYLQVSRRLVLAPAAFWLALAFAPLVACAQSIPRPSSFASPQTMTNSSGEYSPLAIAHTEAMARYYGDSVSGSGTRYFAVTNQTLARISNTTDMGKLLNPEVIKPQDGVRRVEVVVDLSRPIVLHVQPGQTAEVGTVTTVSPANLDVSSYINVSSLTVIGNEKPSK